MNSLAGISDASLSQTSRRSLLPERAFKQKLNEALIANLRESL